ncbi:hypothetical protein TCON_0037 [Astathelohania contejeani]|uniref:Uncharacterized protein n=1 Tax=Astathelohania contejeani TaxID=164912 RepID=A0ABQ7I2U8_9MICR|nr:hypothetical protein TCON_0037 [Thelohania contejeani]
MIIQPDEIPIELNGNPASFKIINTAITIKSETETFNFKTNEIKSLHTRSTDKFYLKMNDFTLTFATVHSRDLIKILILSRIEGSLQERILKSDPSLATSYHTLVDGKRISSTAFWSANNSKLVQASALLGQHAFVDTVSISDKDSLIEVFLAFPIITAIFCSMDISLSQFFNSFRHSYFYDIKNEKNIIDQLIKERMDQYHGIKDQILEKSRDGFAARINYQSEMALIGGDEKKVDKKEITPKEINFEAILAEVPIKQIEKINEFCFPDKLILKCDIEYSIPVSREMVKLPELKGYLEMSKLVFRCKNEEIIDAALKMSEESVDKKYLKRILPQNFIK